MTSEAKIIQLELILSQTKGINDQKLLAGRIRLLNYAIEKRRPASKDLSPTEVLNLLS